jgi:hypothetical protein
VIYPGVGSEIVWGLIAKFKGPQRLFDSVAAQEELGWSDEDRLYVEKRLLGHKDFGRGLYLAPGETLPEDMVEHVKNKTALTKAKARCQFISAAGGEINQCSNEAALGQSFCAEHDPARQQIVKGMLTTDGGGIPEAAAPETVAVSD